MAKFKTREEWLQAAVAALRPKFKAAELAIPARVRVACAWPSEGALSRSNQRIGECWAASASGSKHHEIMVSPILDNPGRVLGVLVHELLHAVLDSQNVKDNHGPHFKRNMAKLGLTGKATATTEGEPLKRELAAITKKLGKYPHAAIKNNLSRNKTQTTRLRKVECGTCGYTVRVTAKWIEVGLPTCCCGGDFEVAA